MSIQLPASRQKCNCSMENETLISAVFKQTPIWDKREKWHRNRNIIEKCWKKIGEEMKVQDVSALRKKWKYLRDQFSVELAKTKPPRSDNAWDSTYESKWPYFHSLLFLKGTVKPRTSKGNCSQTTIGEIVASEDDFPDVDNGASQITSEVEILSVKTENNPDTNSPNSNDFTTTGTPKRKRSQIDSFDATMVHNEEQKLEMLMTNYVKSNDEDEDLLFFKSLLSHVHKIPPNLKLVFRNRVQDIVNDFAYLQVPQISLASSSGFTYSFPNTDSPAPT